MFARTITLITLMSPLLVNCLPPADTHKISRYEQSTCPEAEACLPEEVGYLKPYPPDCTLYYYCDVGGESVLSRCPRYYHFNSATKHCSPNATANCEECVEPTESPTTVPTPSNSYCPPTPVCTNEDLLKSLPYPPDCRKYIYCAFNGDDVIHTCLPGQHFNPELLSCQIWSEANCPYCIEDPDLTTLLDTTTEATATTEVVTETSTATTPVESTVTTPTPEVPICPETPTCEGEIEGTLLPYPLDCEYQLICDGEGGFELRKCREGFEFSPEELWCLPADTANCPYCIATPPPPSCPPIPKCEAEDHGVTKPYPPDCTKYIYCDDDGNEDISPCPPTRPHYSAELNYCTSVEEAACTNCETVTTTTETTSPTTTSPATSPTTTSPTTTSPTTTSPTTTSPTTTTSKTTTSPSTTSPTTTTTKTTTSPTTTTPTTTTPPTTTETTLPDCTPDPDCRILEFNVKKPYPPNCSMYKICHTFVEHEYLSCEEGLHFSDRVKSCVPPEESECTLCNPTGPTVSPPTPLP